MAEDRRLLFAFQCDRTTVFISIFIRLNEIAMSVFQGNRRAGADVFQHLLFIVGQRAELRLVLVALGFRLQRPAISVGVLGKPVFNFSDRLSDKQLLKHIGFARPGAAVQLVAVAAFALGLPGIEFS